MSSKREKEYNIFLKDSIEECIRQLLSEKASDTILAYLEGHHGLIREEIPQNIEGFHSSLTELLGSAAHILEKQIVKILHSKLKIEYVEKKDYEFSDYIKELKNKWR